MSCRGSADPANEEIYRQEGSRPGFPGDHSPLLPAGSSPSHNRKAQDCLGSLTGVRKHSESQSSGGGVGRGLMWVTVHGRLGTVLTITSDSRHTLNALFIESLQPPLQDSL